MSKNVDEATAMAEIVERLSRRFPETAPIDIQQVVDGVYATMDGAPVRDFVPVLVEREAKKRLSVPLAG
jgi:hypothetical protein